MKKSFFFCMVLVFIILNENCTPLYKKVNTDKLQKHPTIVTFRDSYDYKLSSSKAKNKDEYSRKQIESFLCTFVPKYITHNDLSKKYIYKNTDSELCSIQEFFIRSRNINEKELKTANKMEIKKWFESKVIIVCKGSYRHKDIKCVKTFFSIVNKVIGKEKFIFDEHSDIGNIVIEFLNKKPNDSFVDFLGASMLLKDNLKTFFFKVKDKMKIMTYKANTIFASDIFDIKKLSSREQLFMGKNRFVKVFITNIAGSDLKIKTIVHELLHAIGFPGHSPYTGSSLFPVSNPVLARKNKSLFSKLDLCMIEMLYRPEILPAMTLEEAGKIITNLKMLKHTKREDILMFLESKKKSLGNEKVELLEESDIVFYKIGQINKNIERIENFIINIKKNNELTKTDTINVENSKKRIILLKKELSNLNKRKREILSRFKQIVRQIKAIDEESKFL